MEVKNDDMLAEREFLAYKREKERNRIWLDIQVQQIANELKNGLGEEITKIVVEGNHPQKVDGKIKRFFKKLFGIWR